MAATRNPTSRLSLAGSRDFLAAFADEDLRTVVQLILNHLRLEAMQIPIEASRPDNM